MMRRLLFLFLILTTFCSIYAQKRVPKVQWIRLEVGVMRQTLDDSSQTNSTPDKNTTEIGTWTLEVYNATTGEKVFCQEVEGSDFTVDTTGWKPGIYIVRATIGDEILNEKVTVK